MFQYLRVYKKLLLLQVNGESEGFRDSILPRAEALLTRRIHSQTRQDLSVLARETKTRLISSTNIADQAWLQALKADFLRALGTGFALGSSMTQEDVDTINDILEIVGKHALKIPDLRMLTSVNSPTFQGNFGFQISGEQLWLYRGGRAFGIVDAGRVFHRSDVVNNPSNLPLESASIGYNYYRVDAQGNIMPSLEKISSFWETRSISETVFGSNFSRLKEKERAFPRLRDRFNEKVRILENSWARFRAIYSALSQEQQKQVKDTFSTANINFDSPTYPGETEGSSSIPNISQLKDGLNFATVEGKMLSVERALLKLTGFRGDDFERDGYLTVAFRIGRELEVVRRPIETKLATFGLQLDRPSIVEGVSFTPDSLFKNIESGDNYYVFSGYYRGVKIHVRIALFGDHELSVFEIIPAIGRSVLNLDSIRYKEDNPKIFTTKAQLEAFIVGEKAKIEPAFLATQESLKGHFAELIRGNDFGEEKVRRMLRIAEKFNQKSEFKTFLETLLVYRISKAFADTRAYGTFEEEGSHGIDFNFDGSLSRDRGVITSSFGGLLHTIGIRRADLINKLNALRGPLAGHPDTQVNYVRQKVITGSESQQMETFLSTMGLHAEAIAQFKINLNLGIRTVNTRISNLGISTTLASELGEAVRKRVNANIILQALEEIFGGNIGDKNEYARRVVLALDTMQNKRPRAMINVGDTKEVITNSIRATVGQIEEQDRAVKIKGYLEGYGFILLPTVRPTIAGSDVPNFPAIGGDVAKLGSLDFTRSGSADLKQGITLKLKTNTKVELHIDIDGKISGNFSPSTARDEITFISLDPQSKVGIELYLTFMELLSTRLDQQKANALLVKVKEKGISYMRASELLLRDFDIINKRYTGQPQAGVVAIQNLLPSEADRKSLFEILGIIYPEVQAERVDTPGVPEALKARFKLALGVTFEPIIQDPPQKIGNVSIGGQSYEVRGGFVTNQGYYRFGFGKDGDSNISWNFWIHADGKIFGSLSTRGDNPSEGIFLEIPSPDGLKTPLIGRHVGFMDILQASGLRETSFRARRVALGEALKVHITPEAFARATIGIIEILKGFQNGVPKSSMTLAIARTHLNGVSNADAILTALGFELTEQAPANPKILETLGNLFSGIGNEYPEDGTTLNMHSPIEGVTSTFALVHGEGDDKYVEIKFEKGNLEVSLCIDKEGNLHHRSDETMIIIEESQRGLNRYLNFLFKFLTFTNQLRTDDTDYEEFIKTIGSDISAIEAMTGLFSQLKSVDNQLIAEADARRLIAGIPVLAGKVDALLAALGYRQAVVIIQEFDLLPTVTMWITDLRASGKISDIQKTALEAFFTSKNSVDQDTVLVWLKEVSGNINDITFPGLMHALQSERDVNKYEFFHTLLAWTMIKVGIDELRAKSIAGIVITNLSGQHIKHLQIGLVIFKDDLTDRTRLTEMIRAIIADPSYRSALENIVSSVFGAETAIEPESSRVMSRVREIFPFILGNTFPAPGTEYTGTHDGFSIKFHKVDGGDSPYAIIELTKGPIKRYVFFATTGVFLSDSDTRTALNTSSISFPTRNGAGLSELLSLVEDLNISFQALDALNVAIGSAWNLEIVKSIRQLKGAIGRRRDRDVVSEELEKIDALRTLTQHQKNAILVALGVTLSSIIAIPINPLDTLKERLSPLFKRAFGWDDTSLLAFYTRIESILGLDHAAFYNYLSQYIASNDIRPNNLIERALLEIGLDRTPALAPKKAEIFAIVRAFDMLRIEPPPRVSLPFHRQYTVGNTPGDISRGLWGIVEKQYGLKGRNAKIAEVINAIVDYNEARNPDRELTARLNRDTRNASGRGRDGIRGDEIRKDDILLLPDSIAGATRI